MQPKILYLGDELLRLLAESQLEVLPVGYIGEQREGSPIQAKSVHPGFGDRDVNTDGSACHNDKQANLDSRQAKSGSFGRGRQKHRH